ncbi:MAG: ribosome biogenesis GTPase Der [Rickettsiales bacterium]|nr:MAG: ribosome biogenesis GTPase Der [Rickettsiales bacterium]
MNFTVVLIGRPNVGKSTLYNRLIGNKHAIVYDMPGVTRDRRESVGNIGPLSFNVVDTAGLYDDEKGGIGQRMISQTEIAINNADLILLIVDARNGIIEEDKYFANWVRKKSKPVILVINKAESSNDIKNALSDSYRLGFGEAVCISAAHNQGFVDLHDRIAEIKLEYQSEYKLVEDDTKHIQIAIIGKPNVGKSTLLNQLLKTERVITGPEAGLTRDAVSIDWNYNNIPIRLIDTAGLKKSQISNELDRFTIDDTIRAIKYAHVTILLIDANIGIEAQDITIANIAINEGRALIIAVNKWDQVTDHNEFIQKFRYKLDKQLNQVKGVSVIYISALYGENIYTAIDAALDSYNSWNIRVNTALLNQWLKNVLEAHPLPISSFGRRIRIKYITQIKTRPPSFLLFTSSPTEIPDSYNRYLSNSLREKFDLKHTTIRLLYKKGDNPYKRKK